MRCTYVAGGMTGFPAYGFKLFDLARDALTALGWQVVSPADLDRADGFDPIKNPDRKPLDYEFCMKRDQAAMKTCQAAHFLPGWQASKGANREMEYALELGLDLYRCWWTGAEFHEEPIVAIGGSDAHLPDEPCDGDYDQAYGVRAAWSEASRTTTPCALEDSGTRRAAETGAVRDRAVGKGRYDLITPIGLKRLALHYENGAIKYEDRNWEAGMPLHWFLDSMERHVERYKECLTLGEKQTEDHLAAVAWNALGLIHTAEMIRRGKLPAELDDVGHRETEGE